MRSEIDQAIALLKRGDNDSLEKALALLQESVFAFGMRVCGQREDAEDTMQPAAALPPSFLSCNKFGGFAFIRVLHKGAREGCHDFCKSRTDTTTDPAETVRCADGQRTQFSD